MSGESHRYRPESAPRIRGRAASVLGFLERRGVTVPNDVRDRILTCTDSSLLDTWIVRSMLVTTAEELFD
jgi:hypothetical protein